MHSLYTCLVLWMIRPAVERVVDERLSAAARAAALSRPFGRDLAAHVDRIVAKHLDSLDSNGGRWHLDRSGRFDVNPGGESPEGASSCRS